jgi:hypothetical protein
MSKYTEVVDAVHASQTKWSDFRDRCWWNLSTLYREFVTYCEIPRDAIKLTPTDKEPEENTTYALSGAVHFGEDGYWHLGILIILAPQRILIEFCLTEKDGKLHVRAGSGKGRPIDMTRAADRDAFYDEVVDDIKRYFADEPDFHESQATKRIGFGVENGEESAPAQARAATA